MPMPSRIGEYVRTQHRKITITAEVEVHGDDMSATLGPQIAAEVAKTIATEVQGYTFSIREVAAQQEALQYDETGNEYR
jgi:hypothetical protein